MHEVFYVSGIVTILKDSDDVHFILEKSGDNTNKVIVLTKGGWYSINDQDVRFMKLLK